MNGAPAPKESTIVARMLKWLNSLPACYAIKQHGNAFSVAGTPDIMGCFQGWFFAFEVKRVGNKPTAIQEHQMWKWNQAYGFTACVHSLDELKAVMREHFPVDG